MFLFLFVYAQSLLGQYPNGGINTHEGIHISSYYVEMADGVKIAVDLYLPDLKQGEKLPTIINQTRYWRRSNPRWGKAEIDSEIIFFVGKGYAFLSVDTRGSGASFGTRSMPFSKLEIKDGKELVDWVISQPWSNGKVGATGISYEANTAALLALHNHPAVKIVVPRFYDDDVYQDLMWPGGVINKRMAQEWGDAVKELDENKIPDSSLMTRLLIKGVAPVSGHEKELKKAIGEHAGNLKIKNAVLRLRYKDQSLQNSDFNPGDIDFSRQRPALNASETFFYAWGSWMDAGTAQGILRLISQKKANVRAIIGPWSHGGSHHTSPFLEKDAPPSPHLSDQLHQILKAFDYYLKDTPNDFGKDSLLYYYTMGEECWHHTQQWPPAGIHKEEWNLLSNFSLSKAEGKSEKMVYSVDPNCTTGVQNRWNTQLNGQDVVYEEPSTGSINFTSAPLEDSMEVTGFPMVTIKMTATQPDSNIFIYLEDVDPHGKSRYLTEGILALRFLEAQGFDKNLGIPIRDYKSTHAEELEPGRFYTFTVPLLPTSTVFRQGHCIRVRVTGADKDHFGPPLAKDTWTIDLEKTKLILPTKMRPDLNEAPQDLNSLCGDYSGKDLQVTVKTGGISLLIKPHNQKTLEMLLPQSAHVLNLDDWTQKMNPIVKKIETGAFKDICKVSDTNRLEKEIKVLKRLFKKAPNWKIAAGYYDRGFNRIYLKMSPNNADGFVALLFNPTTDKLTWTYKDVPYPGTVRVMPTRSNHFKDDGLIGIHCFFENGSLHIGNRVLYKDRLNAKPLIAGHL